MSNAQTSRQKVLDIFTHSAGAGCAMWTGHPNPETVPIYAKEWGIEATPEAIFNFLGDDCRWLSADQSYFHPQGMPAFDPAYHTRRDTLSAGGYFAQAETVQDLEGYPWPDPRYCNFEGVFKQIEEHRDHMVFTGFWCPFFHLVADFFGMENYFIKMYE